MICIKRDKYGNVFIPETSKGTQKTKNPSGENQMDKVKEDISRIRDEMVKQNRDQLDAMYNLDMDNMSSGLRKLFASWSDGVKSALAGVEAVADSQKSLVESYTQFQTEVSQSVTSIKQISDANSTSIRSIAEWQSSTSQTISSIQQTANEQGARIDLVVSGTGENAEVNAASITAAIAGDESFIQLIADRVTIEGTAEFVTKDDLSNDSGSTVISGNLIRISIDGTDDDGETTLNSSASLDTVYEHDGFVKLFGGLYTLIDGTDTNITSRYKLVLDTQGFTNAEGEFVYPAISIQPYGNLALESGEGMIYMKAEYSTCVIDVGYGTRIRANNSYSGSIGMESAASNDYVFASDGIYYNGVKIVNNRTAAT